jgi:hypothetical protein
MALNVSLDVSFDNVWDSKGMLETAGEDREYEILYKKMIKLLVEF